MERAIGIGGVFLRARDPKALLAWYRDRLGIEPDGDFDGKTFESGPTVWALFPEDTEYFGKRSQQAMVNYRVRDLDAVLEQLRAGGAEVDERIEEHEFGRFGWATDPEGNRLELWQPPA